MTIRTEDALAGFHAALAAAFVAASMPTVQRNRALAEVTEQWPSGAAGKPRLALGMADGSTNVDDILLSPMIYELTQQCVVEIIVEDRDDERRLATFAACLEVVAAVVETLHETPTPLGSSVAAVRIDRIEREQLVTENTPGTSAAAVVINFTLNSERPF